MDRNEIKYKQKAISSFKTKFEIYLFMKTINRNLTIISPADFESFKITDEIVNIYTTIYWQECKDQKINGILIQDIEKNILEWKQQNRKLIMQLRNNYIANCFPKLFPKKDFLTLLENTTCTYCRIAVKEIEKLSEERKLFKKNFRGWNMEIDRLNSNYEYSKNNCVMACYWCNNAKSDEFTEDEFALIGITISKIWKTRINK